MEDVRWLPGGIILEDEEMDIYDRLDETMGKFLRNVEGLGKSSSVKTEGDARKEGLKILKDKYPDGYERLSASIKELSREFIRKYCFSVMFYEDAAGTMIVDIPETLKTYVSERNSDITKALFEDYSVTEFCMIADEIRGKVVSLALCNWQIHGMMNKRKSRVKAT